MTSTPVASQKRYRKHLPIVAGAVVLLLVVVAVVLVIKNFISDSDEPKKRKVQQISLVKPPEPPPPPPKPPEEKPPEPKDEIKQEEQKPTPQPQNTDQPPPGIGGAGYGNGDTSFGGSGGWMGGSGRFGYYIGGVQKGVYEALDRNEKLRKREYKAVVAVWLGQDGTVTRVELREFIGDKELDALIKKTLIGIKLDEPPSDIQQPLKWRMSSR